VKSTTNVLGGGRTQWANFYNACFLTIFLLLGRGLINSIPYAVLGAVLIYTGYRLCRPSVWRHIASIGPEQLIPFTVTLVVTVCTDLLIGIGAGIATKLAMNLWLGARASIAKPLFRAMLASVKELPAYFCNPVTKREQKGNEYHLTFGKPLVCFNVLHLNSELAKIPTGVTRIYLHITEAVLLIDHTSCDKLFHFVDEHNRQGLARVEIVGLDHFARRSEFRTSMRLGTSARQRINRGFWGHAMTRLMAVHRLDHANGEHAAPDHPHLGNDELAKYALSALGPASVASSGEDLDRMALSAKDRKSRDHASSGSPRA
jgi:carbonic anhydrase